MPIPVDKRAFWNLARFFVLVAAVATVSLTSGPAIARTLLNSYDIQFPPPPAVLFKVQKFADVSFVRDGTFKNGKYAGAVVFTSNNHPIVDLANGGFDPVDSLFVVCYLFPDPNKIVFQFTNVAFPTAPALSSLIAYDISGGDQELLQQVVPGPDVAVTSGSSSVSAGMLTLPLVLLSIQPFFEDPSVVKITAATTHLLNCLKPSARVKKLIAPQHAPSLISALRPAFKD